MRSPSRRASSTRRWRASHNYGIEISLRAIRDLLHELHVRNTTVARARRVVQTHRDIYTAGDGVAPAS